MIKKGQDEKHWQRGQTRDFDFDEVNRAVFEICMNCRGAPLEGRGTANVE
jgi:hypothetical protein